MRWIAGGVRRQLAIEQFVKFFLTKDFVSANQATEATARERGLSSRYSVPAGRVQPGIWQTPFSPVADGRCPGDTWQRVDVPQVSVPCCFQALMRNHSLRIAD
jgi:hypothetical protein